MDFSGFKLFQTKLGSDYLLEALKDTTAKLKQMMLSRVGDKDTINYNQKIIAATIKDI